MQEVREEIMSKVAKINSRVSSLIEKNFTLSLECDGLKTDLVKITSIAEARMSEVIALRAERCKLLDDIYRLSKLSQEHHRIQTENNAIIDDIWNERLVLRNECTTLRRIIGEVLGKRLDEAKFAVGASIDHELESDLTSTVDHLELLQKQAEDLRPLQPM